MESFTSLFPSYKERTLKAKVKYDVWPFVLALIQTLKPHKVLDVGSATGLYVLAMRQNNVKSFGVDSNEEAISSASELVRNYLYTVDLDRNQIPFPDNSFDVVFCLRTAEYFRNTGHAFSEISRVARDHALFITVNSRSFNRTMKRTREKESWLAILRNCGLEETSYCKKLEFQFKLRYLVNVLRNMSIGSDAIQALISTFSLLFGYHFLVIVSKSKIPRNDNPSERM